jgi:sterol desaturase/sphingolipid hydroxylase (fatty acid hydroxylase superfamily)
MSPELAGVLVQGITLLLPVIFIYGLAEGLYLHFGRGLARLGEYRTMGIATIVVAIAFVLAGAVVPVGATIYAFIGTDYAPFHAGLSPLGIVYGWIVYEGAYWVQHWAAHNIRLLWCIHSPHHAPTSMNMFVGFNHSFIESVFYMPLMLGLVPALLGVDPLFIGVISAIDAVWGNMLHISDHVVPRRYGILERFLQTPSYQRVHHAQNVRYMDTNYNSITLLWDWLLGTLEPLDDREPVEFGITREVNTSSFLDVHFGEFVLLWRDLRSASSLRSAAAYLMKPPGWSENGELKTAAARKAHLAEQHSGVSL